MNSQRGDRGKVDMPVGKELGNTTWDHKRPPVNTIHSRQHLVRGREERIKEKSRERKTIEKRGGKPLAVLMVWLISKTPSRHKKSEEKKEQGTT